MQSGSVIDVFSNWVKNRMWRDCMAEARRDDEWDRARSSGVNLVFSEAETIYAAIFRNECI